MTDFTAVSQFLDLVKNSDKYEKALDQLKTQQNELLKLIAVAGKAQEIPMLHEKAEKAVDVAKANAEKIVSDAQKAASEAFIKATELNAKAVKALAEANAMMTEANAVKKLAAEKQTELDRLTSETQKKYDSNLAREVVLSQSQQALDERLAKIQSLIA